MFCALNRRREHTAGLCGSRKGIRRYDRFAHLPDNSRISCPADLVSISFGRFHSAVEERGRFSSCLYYIQTEPRRTVRQESRASMAPLVRTIAVSHTRYTCSKGDVCTNQKMDWLQVRRLVCPLRENTLPLLQPESFHVWLIPLPGAWMGGRRERR